MEIYMRVQVPTDRGIRTPDEAGVTSEPLDLGAGDQLRSSARAVPAANLVISLDYAF